MHYLENHTPISLAVTVYLFSVARVMTVMGSNLSCVGVLKEVLPLLGHGVGAAFM